VSVRSLDNRRDISGPLEELDLNLHSHANMIKGLIKMTKG
jgi:hypothetical protein